MAGVRWDAIREDAEPGQAQALFERGAVARSFDTPGFRGMTFYEVRARSVINKVPEASRVPFRWTINPYRGCSHACTYCLVGVTPILMGDGRTKPMAEVRVGDAVYGTVRRGSLRRYVLTQVLAHWETTRPAHLVVLADGTRLLASGEHRFLTSRGWKHVSGAEQGAARRPHLTASSELLGVGAFADQPKESADYRRGYLCGVMRGDGSMWTARRRLAGGPARDDQQFLLAQIDSEGLPRTRDYLARAGMDTTDFTFAEQADAGRQMLAIRACARDSVRLVERLIRWPREPGADWQKGFLAAMFDAEGSYGDGILRIGSTDPDMIAWTLSCLTALRFDTTTDRPDRPDERTWVRLRGGLREVLRFFHTTDPAITGKRCIEGAVIKGGAELRVAQVESLGVEMPMYDITTGTGDFIANGVVSHNCFARNTHKYLDLDAGHDFDSKIVVKVNAPEVVRKELAAPRWRGEHIAMGTNVDCYQRAEGRYQLMPGILTALRDAANPFSILTKGTLILRDKELLAEASQITDVGLAVSVGCADEDLWRTLEPGTPSPLRRLAACAELARSGLPCAVLMGPVVPFLSDSPGQLARTVRLAAEAGARSVTPIVLHLRPGAREWFLAWLGEHHPELVSRYAELYGRGAYAPQAYQRRIAGQVASLAQRYRVGHDSPKRWRASEPRDKSPGGAQERTYPLMRQVTQVTGPAPGADMQLRLF